MNSLGIRIRWEIGNAISSFWSPPLELFFGE